MPNVQSDNLLIGFDTADDACVYQVGDSLGLIETVDFFPPMVDDPYLFGQIAAANSLSDVYAMGGKPVLAMNLLCVPDCLPIEVAGQILKGGADKCVEAGCPVAGGHTIEDKEPKYGLCVSGLVPLDKVLANGGARSGDVLVLTKAIGTGVLTTAVKGELMSEAEAAYVWEAMRTLNEAPIRLAEGLDVHGCTDITGFGLAGHTCEMAEASGVTIELTASSVPLLDQAMDFAQMGIIPGGTYRNQDYFASRVAMDEGLPDAMPELLYDPQTAGGLLVSLPEDDARTLCGRLEAEGRLAVVIGRVEELGAHAVTVRP